MSPQHAADAREVTRAIPVDATPVAPTPDAPHPVVPDPPKPEKPIPETYANTKGSLYDDGLAPPRLGKP